jgi:hypothetical protein
MLRLSRFHRGRPRPPVRACSEMDFVSTGQAPAVAELRASPFLSVLSGSPPARRDAELHGRPVQSEADQLEAELTREVTEVVPEGVPIMM